MRHTCVVEECSFILEIAILKQGPVTLLPPNHKGHKNSGYIQINASTKIYFQNPDLYYCSVLILFF